MFMIGLALAILPAGQTALAAQASKCPPYSKPITLDFKLLNPAPIYNNRLNILGIRNLFRSHTEAVLGPHESALGITYAETVYSAEANSRAEEVRGGYCVYLTEMDISFGWKRMSVYVASEFQPETCEYNAVLDHENQHVTINNTALKEYAPRFRAEVERVLQAQQPVFTSNPQAGVDAGLAAVERRMSAVLNEFQNTMAKRNAPLDSDSNYSETGKLCTNWNGAKGARRTE